MGQNAHHGRARARRFAAACCLSLAAPFALTGCGSSLAAAPTILNGVADVQVVHSDGTAVEGVNGLHLRPGDVVHTGAHGRAELDTRGRVVYEGSAAAVQ